MTWRRIKSEAAYYLGAVWDALIASATFSFRGLPLSEPRFRVGISGTALMAFALLVAHFRPTGFRPDGSISGYAAPGLLIIGGAIWFIAFMWDAIEPLFASLRRRFHRRA